MNGRTFDEEALLSRDRYFAADYFTRAQFDSLVSQILEVVKLKPRRILEVGPGNGFVSNFLRSAGFEVITFDINQSLKPDVVGNLTEIDRHFPDSSFDLILCAEVLEHLPFELFETILKKFAVITREHVVITLPRQHHIILDWRMYVKIPFVRPINLNWFWRIPHRTKWEGHHWEVDYQKKYSLRSICEIMARYFQVTACQVDERVRHHQFFILKRNG